MTQLLKVEFKLRVENVQQFKDVVVVMTSAANHFFNKYHKEGDDATVRDYKCSDNIKPHPTEMSEEGEEFTKLLREYFK